MKSSPALSCLWLVLALFLSVFSQAQTTFTGAINTDWHTAGNWSSGVPTTGSTAIIPNGLTAEYAGGVEFIQYDLQIEGHLIVSGYMVPQGLTTLSSTGSIDVVGTFEMGGTILAEGAITISGEMNNYADFTQLGGSITNTGFLRNFNNTFVCNGTVDCTGFLANHGLWVIGGPTTFNQELTNYPSATLQVDAAGTLVDGGYFWNQGNFVLEGQLQLLPSLHGDDFTSTSSTTIGVGGSFLQAFGAGFFNLEGSLENQGVMELNDVLFVQPTATFRNDVSGTVDMLSALDNLGLLVNKGQMTYGALTSAYNAGTITNLGTFNNNTAGWGTEPMSVIYSCEGTWNGSTTVPVVTLTGCPLEGACDGVDNDFDLDVDETCGCLDPVACNYDASLVLPDGSCTYPGCTDPTACNFDLAAACDDGSCVAPSGIYACAGASSVAFGGTGGDLIALPNYDAGNPSEPACNSNTTTPSCGTGDFHEVWVSVTYTAGTEWTFSTVDLNGVNPTRFAVYDGCGGNEVLCASSTDAATPAAVTASCDGVLVDGQTYYIAMGCSDGLLANILLNITTDACPCNDPVACNYDPADTVDTYCEYPGCTDPAACNYDPAAPCDDGSCIEPGCLDPLACNYDEAATCDSGVCSYQWDPCTGQCVSPNAQYLGFGAGYGAGDWTVFSFIGFPSNPNPAGIGSLTLNSGSAILEDLANDAFFNEQTIMTAIAPRSGEITFDWEVQLTGGPVTAGGYYSSNGNTVVLTGTSGSESVMINAGESVIFGIVSDGDGVPDRLILTNYTHSAAICGCTDAAACNYNPEATNDYGCEYGGCTTPEACNYDPAATCDDRTCEFTSCAGCTYAEASNYDAAATIDDGSCILAPAPVCAADLNGDGLVGSSDLLEVLADFGTSCPD